MYDSLLAHSDLPCLKCAHEEIHIIVLGNVREFCGVSIENELFAAAVRINTISNFGQFSNTTAAMSCKFSSVEI